MPPAAQASPWIAFLVAIASVCVGALAVWVALRQSKTSRQKLRLDLYDKRFAVFERTLAFYSALLGSAESLQSDAFESLFREFIRAHNESQFLFDPESGIFKLLGQMVQRAGASRGFKTHAREADPNAVLELHKNFQEALTFWYTSMGQLGQAIAPYLNFHKVLS
jgi:hypothetical protein